MKHLANSSLVRVDGNLSDSASDSEKSLQPTGNRKAKQQNTAPEQEESTALQPQKAAPPPEQHVEGGRIAPGRQSRIVDRPAKVGEKDSSLKIKIELDLEVEVDLYARVKGDITIGLM